MVLGDKLFEEKGNMTMTFVEDIEKGGIVLKQSFNSEVTGIGNFPSGKNMGSGTIWIHETGKAGGKWQGMMMTDDNELIVWKGSGHSLRSGTKIKGIMVLTFMTKSEKYSWLNSLIAVSDIEGDMMSFASTTYMWK